VPLVGKFVMYFRSLIDAIYADCYVNLQVIDFHSFEELFKLGNLQLADLDGDSTLNPANKQSKRLEVATTTLLDPNRMRNVGKGLLFVVNHAGGGNSL
jgi:hypothetical protein